ncbi:MAG: NnrS family protein [Gammaproteobacteria bacterium]|nr:MAG: NnrS family protein [Gammaproteobacteria bacterium]
MPLFNLGFRPFFLAAGLFSAVAMIAWGFAYPGLITLPLNLPAMFWHGHEMIFGYAVAVIAGFLLTSVRNWTGLPTPHGWPLAGLVGLWLAARAAFWNGHLLLAMGADLLFALALLLSLLTPLIRTRQTAQIGLMSWLILLLASNQLFYLITAELSAPWLPNTVNLRQPLMAGLYVLVAFVLLMIGRLLPAFTRMATGGKVELVELAGGTQTKSVMTLLMVLFVLLAPNWLNSPTATALAEITALLLAVLHGYQLWRWRHREIAARPLLWVIYAAYLFFVIGFLAYAAQPLGVPGIVATHALAVGGVGLATLGLMARVALGHTGRDVYHPPKLILPMILLLVTGSVLRVCTPVLFPQFYLQGVIIAQFFWVAAFLAFLLVYTPMLVTTRPDGKPG